MTIGEKLYGILDKGAHAPVEGVAHSFTNEVWNVGDETHKRYGHFGSLVTATNAIFHNMIYSSPKKRMETEIEKLSYLSNLNVPEIKRYDWNKKEIIMKRLRPKRKDEIVNLRDYLRSNEFFDEKMWTVKEAARLLKKIHETKGKEDYITHGDPAAQNFCLLDEKELYVFDFEQEKNGKTIERRKEQDSSDFYVGIVIPLADQIRCDEDMAKVNKAIKDGYGSLPKLDITPSTIIYAKAFNCERFLQI